MMKLDKSRDLILDEKGIPGLVTAEFEYKIGATTAKMVYGGPKIPPVVWHEVLSFFRWTYKEYHSESQVRLYVNPVQKTWRAWAFPQEARTGMTAHELGTPETPEQAAVRFKTWGSLPDGDWIYFATVHHHCSAGAFQSGTDLANEKNQDGLHITVGLIDKPQHDLHSRFYLQGTLFNATMDMFWDIGQQLLQMTPECVWEVIAKHQMTTVHEVDFPQQWRDNIIEIKTKSGFFGLAANPGGNESWRASGLGYVKAPLSERSGEALDEIIDDLTRAGYPIDEIKGIIKYAGTSEEMKVIWRNCSWKDCDPDDITRLWDVDKITVSIETGEAELVPQRPQLTMGSLTPDTKAKIVPQDDGAWGQ